MASSKEVGRVVIEDAPIRFRNFSGKEGQFNRAGDRNFAVLLDPELARTMKSDGWNVKQLRAREEGDIDQDYIQVKVNFSDGRRPPRVVMVTSRGKTTLGEDEINILDWADISKVDLIIRPYLWEVSGKSGIAAYLYSIFVTINEDELDLKYADVPDSAQNSSVTFVPLDDDDLD